VARAAHDGAIDVLSGHMAFGAHRHLPGRYTYVTFLRDPVDRVISDYFYVLRTPSHVLYDPVATERYTLADYVTSGITFFTNNLHARLLSGRGETVPVGACTDALVDEAIAHLEAHPSVVGLTERFDESIVLMKHRLGWRLPLYRVKNKTQGRPRKSEVSEADRALIRAHNAQDLALYAYARTRFETAWAEAPATCQRDLDRLHRLNWLFGPVERAYVSLRRTVNTLAGRRVV
jgi:hypothetical protein